MPDPKPVAQQFLDALAANDPARVADTLHQDSLMRIYRWDGGDACRPRERVVQRLQEEWAAWPDAKLEIFRINAGDDSAAVEFRIQATENGRYVEHNRAAFLTLKDGKVQAIDLYCPAPLPSARRKGWIAPATLSEQELNRLFESYAYTFDARDWVPPNFYGHLDLELNHGGSYDPHPGSNSVGNVHWSAEDADARIEEMIAHFRNRGCGFVWSVSSFDTPADLRERLERHGLVLAGDQALMARLGLDDLDDIPLNREIEVELVDGSNDEAIEAVLQTTAACFNWTPAQIDDRRKGFFERVRDPVARQEEIQYLARLNGTPVGCGRLILRAGTAYLGGAGTLREHRSRKIYSTLLRRRLEAAHARGYQISAIHAEPMSRRVVSRYGFKEYARFYLYAWMPVIDMDIVRSLVPDE